MRFWWRGGEKQEGERGGRPSPGNRVSAQKGCQRDRPRCLSRSLWLWPWALQKHWQRTMLPPSCLSLSLARHIPPWKMARPSFLFRELTQSSPKTNRAAFQLSDLLLETGEWKSYMFHLAVMFLSGQFCFLMGDTFHKCSLKSPLHSNWEEMNYFCLNNSFSKYYCCYFYWYTYRLIFHIGLKTPTLREVPVTGPPPPPPPPPPGPVSRMEEGRLSPQRALTQQGPDSSAVKKPQCCTPQPTPPRSALCTM